MGMRACAIRSGERAPTSNSIKCSGVMTAMHAWARAGSLPRGEALPHTTTRRPSNVSGARPIMVSAARLKSAS